MLCITRVCGRLRTDISTVLSLPVKRVLAQLYML